MSSNTQQVNLFCLRRRSAGDSLIFTGKPSEGLRKLLLEKGYRYNNGNWYRSNSQPQGFQTEAEVAKALATA